MIEHIYLGRPDDDEAGPLIVDARHTDVSPQVFNLSQLFVVLIVIASVLWLTYDWYARRKEQQAFQAREDFWTKAAIANMFVLMIVTYISFYVDSNVTNVNTPDIPKKLPYITPAHRKLEEVFIDRDAIRNDETTRYFLTYTLFATTVAIALLAFVILFPRYFWQYDVDDPAFQRVSMRRLTTREQDLRDGI